jgi:tRNA pseudouridine55 synthase
VDGALLVVKPPGMTSHDVVDFFRRCTGVKAGHTGTLDPAAAGLLVLCVGKATRLAQYLVGCDKTYWAEIAFGLTTDTGDAEGQIIARGGAESLTAEAVTAALATLTGALTLPVPRYSAIKSGGRPLHRRARRGEAVEAPEREMRVDRWELREFLPGPAAVARTVLDCAGGTYVRSLVAALAQAVEVPAYLSFLVRTRVGQFRLEDAATLEEIEQAAQAERLVLPPAEALAHLPALTLDADQARRVAQGMSVPWPVGSEADQPLRRLDAQGGLLAVGRAVAADGACLLRPETVLATAD